MNAIVIFGLLLILSDVTNSQYVNCYGKNAICTGPLSYKACVDDGSGIMIVDNSHKLQLCPPGTRCRNNGPNICQGLRAPETSSTTTVTTQHSMTSPSTTSPPETTPLSSTDKSSPASTSPKTTQPQLSSTNQSIESSLLVTTSSVSTSPKTPKSSADIESTGSSNARAPPTTENSTREHVTSSTTTIKPREDSSSTESSKVTPSSENSSTEFSTTIETKEYSSIEANPNTVSSSYPELSTALASSTTNTDDSPRNSSVATTVYSSTHTTEKLLLAEEFTMPTKVDERAFLTTIPIISSESSSQFPETTMEFLSTTITPKLFTLEDDIAQSPEISPESKSSTEFHLSTLTTDKRVNNSKLATTEHSSTVTLSSNSTSTSTPDPHTPVTSTQPLRNESSTEEYKDGRSTHLIPENPTETPSQVMVTNLQTEETMDSITTLGEDPDSEILLPTTLFTQSESAPSLAQDKITTESIIESKPKDFHTTAEHPNSSTSTMDSKNEIASDFSSPDATRNPTKTTADLEIQTTPLTYSEAESTPLSSNFTTEKERVSIYSSPLGLKTNSTSLVTKTTSTPVNPTEHAGSTPSVESAVFIEQKVTSSPETPESTRSISSSSAPPKSTSASHISSHENTRTETSSISTSSTPHSASSENTSPRSTSVSPTEHVGITPSPESAVVVVQEITSSPENPENARSSAPPGSTLASHISSHENTRTENSSISTSSTPHSASSENTSPRSTPVNPTEHVGSTPSAESAVVVVQEIASSPETPGSARSSAPPEGTLASHISSHENTQTETSAISTSSTKQSASSENTSPTMSRSSDTTSRVDSTSDILSPENAQTSSASSTPQSASFSSENTAASMSKSSEITIKTNVSEVDSAPGISYPVRLHTESSTKSAPLPTQSSLSIESTTLAMSRFEVDFTPNTTVTSQIHSTSSEYVAAFENDSDTTNSSPPKSVINDGLSSTTIASYASTHAIEARPTGVINEFLPSQVPLDVYTDLITEESTSHTTNIEEASSIMSVPLDQGEPFEVEIAGDLSTLPTVANTVNGFTASIDGNDSTTTDGGVNQTSSVNLLYSEEPDYGISSTIERLSTAFYSDIPVTSPSPPEGVMEDTKFDCSFYAIQAGFDVSDCNEKANTNVGQEASIKGLDAKEINKANEVNLPGVYGLHSDNTNTSGITETLTTPKSSKTEAKERVSLSSSSNSGFTIGRLNGVESTLVTQKHGNSDLKPFITDSVRPMNSHESPNQVVNKDIFSTHTSESVDPALESEPEGAIILGSSISTEATASTPRQTTSLYILPKDPIDSFEQRKPGLLPTTNGILSTFSNSLFPKSSSGSNSSISLTTNTADSVRFKDATDSDAEATVSPTSKPTVQYSGSRQPTPEEPSADLDTSPRDLTDSLEQRRTTESGLFPTINEIPSTFLSSLQSKPSSESNRNKSSSSSQPTGLKQSTSSSSKQPTSDEPKGPTNSIEQIRTTESGLFPTINENPSTFLSSLQSKPSSESNRNDSSSLSQPTGLKQSTSSSSRQPTSDKPKGLTNSFEQRTTTESGLFPTINEIPSTFLSSLQSKPLSESNRNNSSSLSQPTDLKQSTSSSSRKPKSEEPKGPIDSFEQRRTTESGLFSTINEIPPTFLSPLQSKPSSESNRNNSSSLSQPTDLKQSTSSSSRGTTSVEHSPALDTSRRGPIDSFEQGRTTKTWLLPTINETPSKSSSNGSIATNVADSVEPKNETVNGHRAADSSLTQPTTSIQSSFSSSKQTTSAEHSSALDTSTRGPTDSLEQRSITGTGFLSTTSEIPVRMLASLQPKPSPKPDKTSQLSTQESKNVQASSINPGSNGISTKKATNIDFDSTSTRSTLDQTRSVESNFVLNNSSKAPEHSFDQKKTSRNKIISTTLPDPLPSKPSPEPIVTNSQSTRESDSLQADSIGTRGPATPTTVNSVNINEGSMNTTTTPIGTSPRDKRFSIKPVITKSPLSKATSKKSSPATSTTPSSKSAQKPHKPTQISSKSSENRTNQAEKPVPTAHQTTKVPKNTKGQRKADAHGRKPYSDEEEDSLSISNERPVKIGNPHADKTRKQKNGTDDNDDADDERDVDNRSSTSSSASIEDDEEDEQSSKERKKIIKKAFNEFKEGEWNCRDIGIIPDFDDCRKYYLCYEKKDKIKKTHLKCPKNTLFDRKEEKCVYKKKADCAEKQHIFKYLGRMKDLLD